MSNDVLQKMESSAVQAHVSMLQGIINRMANNSANCKTWTITIVAAMLVLLVDKIIICLMLGYALFQSHYFI